MDLLTVEEAADFMHIPVATLRHWMEQIRHRRAPVWAVVGCSSSTNWRSSCRRSLTHPAQEMRTPPR
jgi:hypothetical protein